MSASSVGKYFCLLNKRYFLVLKEEKGNNSVLLEVNNGRIWYEQNLAVLNQVWKEIR